MSKNKKTAEKAVDKTKKRNKKTRGIGGKIVTAILVLIGIFACLTALLNFITCKSLIKTATSFSAVENKNMLKPEFINGNAVYTSDRELKICDLSDIHISAGILTLKVDKAAIIKIAETITKEKPDLVILSGDVNLVNNHISGTFNNRYTARIIVKLMETLQVYWAPTFNNKDSDLFTLFDSEAIAKYMSHKNTEYSVYTVRKMTAKDYGNYKITVNNSDHNFIQGLVILDSHSYIQSQLLTKTEKSEFNKDNWKDKAVEEALKKNPEAVILSFPN